MSDIDNNELDCMELRDDETMEQYKKRTKKVATRLYDHFFLTCKASDTPFIDTMDYIMELLKDTTKILKEEEWITDLAASIEWNKKEQFDEAWMWFPHYHFHMPGKCEKLPKWMIKKRIREALEKIWPENKFDKRWIVFGHHGKKQFADYVTYINKQNPMKILKRGNISWDEQLKTGKVFQNDERKTFRYGINSDERLAQTIRVIEKEIYQAIWRWKICQHRLLWMNNNGDVIANHNMFKIFMKTTKYRVFRNKMYKHIKYVFSHVPDLLTSLEA